jgi:hypothetical protein
VSAKPLVGDALLGVRSAAGFDAAVPARLVATTWRRTGAWIRGRVVAAMLGLPAGDPS